MRHGVAEILRSRAPAVLAAGAYALLIASAPGDGVYGDGAATLLYVLPPAVVAIAYGVPAAVLACVASLTLIAIHADGFGTAGAFADVAPAIALAAIGTGLGLHVRALHMGRQRMQTTIDRLRTSQLAREELVSDFERARRTDDVTGLGNLRHLDAELPRLVTEADAAMSSLAVLTLELDDRTWRRDADGDLTRDRMLKALASEWQRHMRVHDVLVRTGDGEFVAVLAACSPPNAQRVAERLVAAAPQWMVCRVGVALWDGAESGERLLGRAREAMRAADRAGAAVRVAG